MERRTKRRTGHKRSNIKKNRREQRRTRRNMRRRMKRRASHKRSNIKKEKREQRRTRRNTRRRTKRRMSQLELFIHGRCFCTISYEPDFEILGQVVWLVACYRCSCCFAGIAPPSSCIIMRLCYSYKQGGW